MLVFVRAQEMTAPLPNPPSNSDVIELDSLNESQFVQQDKESVEVRSREANREHEGNEFLTPSIVFHKNNH